MAIFELLFINKVSFITFGFIPRILKAQTGLLQKFIYWAQFIQHLLLGPNLRILISPSFPIRQSFLCRGLVPNLINIISDHDCPLLTRANLAISSSPCSSKVPSSISDDQTCFSSWLPTTPREYYVGSQSGNYDIAHLSGSHNQTKPLPPPQRLN